MSRLPAWWPMRQRQPAQPFAVAACLAVYLLLCLQQVVLTGRYFGVGLSLGSMAIRGAALAGTAWALWRHGVPTILRRPLLAMLLCMAALAASVMASGHMALASKYAVRYATELLSLWALLNLAIACQRWPRAVALALLLALWFNLALGVAVLRRWPWAWHLSLAFHPRDTFKYLPRISGMYEHPALLAASALVVALLVIQLHRRGELGPVALTLALLGAALALALTQVRNALVPLAGVVLWWFWPWRAGARLGRGASLAALAGLALLGGFVLWRRYTDMVSAVHESVWTQVSLGRTYLWAGAVEAWRGHPWFGLGAGVFQFLVPDYTGGRFDRGELHAHNLLLGVLSETGLCGLFACLLLLYALWAPLLGNAATRGWTMLWFWWLLSLGVFDFYWPFYAFTLHAAVATAVLYAQAATPHGVEPDHREPAEVGAGKTQASAGVVRADATASNVSSTRR